MKPRIKDKIKLRQQIRQLENIMIELQYNEIIQLSSTPECIIKTYWEVWNAIKVEVNSAKLEYETNFGSYKWKLTPKGYNQF